MRKYRRYERYKDSGVEWIGEIPEEWEVKKLKHISNITMGQSPKSEECSLDEIGLPFLQGNAEFTSLHPIPKMYCNTANKFSKINDILLSVRAPVGAMNISDRVYGIGRGLCAVTANKVQVRYLWYSMNVSLEELFIKSKGSTFEAVTVTDVNNLLSILPPKKEQIAIANFLDQKTVEIDGLIADKEKLVGLLHEKRQAIISEALTKGLNPNVSMKDSGVEWIGEIPEHWDIIPLKHVTNFISRGNSPEYVEESSIKVINQACIYWDGLKIENVKYQNEDIDFDKLKGKLVKGDLLLNSTGTGTLGRAVVFREDGNYMADSHVTIVRFNKMKMDEILAFYILQTKIYQGYIYNALVTGATNQIELSRERLTVTPMIVPPSIEQQEIMNFLDAKIGQIAILINKIKIQIEKLKKYRQSLISEAVTGKIDVRDYKVD